MRKILFIFFIAGLTAACNTASTDDSQQQAGSAQPTTSIIGKWNAVLDLSQADSTDMMIKELQRIAAITKSVYVFKQDGKGESVVYSNDTLDNQTAFFWKQNGDTITTSNEYSTNTFVLDGPDRMNNTEFKDNPQKVDHYLVR